MIIMVKFENDIIFAESENARIKIKELSDILKLSSQRLKYDIASLEKESIIYNPYCIFDYSFFGLMLFRVYFKGAYISENHKEYIIKRLSENSYVSSIYEITGEFDLVAEILAPNPSRFNDVLKNISNEIPTLGNYKILLNIITYLYPRFYLAENNIIKSVVPDHAVIGGDRSIENFSDDELSLMKCLLDNSKLRMSALAKSAGMNTKTAKSLLKSLRQRNVIKGFRYILDTNKLNINSFRIYIKLHNLSSEREKDFMDYLAKTKEIVLANKTVGDWDLEIDIESKDKTRIRKLTIELKEVFKDIIQNFNMMEKFRAYKKTYLPRFMFDKDIRNLNK
jgi:DNA-binding Lrp family transcriptional regulator